MRGPNRLASRTRPECRIAFRNASTDEIAKERTDYRELFKRQRLQLLEVRVDVRETCQCVGRALREEALVDLNVEMERERKSGARGEPVGGASGGRVEHVGAMQKQENPARLEVRHATLQLELRLRAHE